MGITDLARPEILALQPYASARSSMSAEGILLNANEAPTMLVDDPALQSLALNRYPAPQPAALRERLAELYGVAEDRLLLTRGSDEGIDLLVRVFCRPGQDAVAECPPCFGMYRIAAAIQGADVVTVSREPPGLGLDLPGLCNALAGDPRIRIVFLTSPNNPTGDRVTPAQLEQVLQAAEGRALVVLDEAYIEFCSEPSAVSLIDVYPHLVVLRTLSKAWAAAGLRCGCVVADPAVIGLLRRVMAPYPLTAPAIHAALQATGEGARTRQTAMLQAVSAEKNRLLEFLAGRDWIRALWPGEANFVLIRVDDADALQGWCAERGIRIRSFDGQPMLEGCLRLTIGAPDEMQALLAAFEAWETRQ
ncbi:MAG: histidinol-phosphate transaminase [Xanthomonadales bacterium]|nr:histidinol-phosphate transaminase [Xanthomonadales bacterium]NIN58798.1 histidinol-phosphate transaminase [Xanthomonadales bacterium]NIN74066.1 histidinol-phosphate transaminase [Xanthomonadales bacterium]NIO14599.1 histidinol-phosphate transaminase [Xanthomonadales bacterium]NIP11191.1 histidinol-phosphate transaminase [Xanthomonadales bacterium]